jgi:hypothetical protein
MSFHVHIINIANDAYKKLGFIMRISKHPNDIYTLSHLLNGIIRENLSTLPSFGLLHINHIKIRHKNYRRGFLRYLFCKEYVSYICLPK